jgi:hypothetical protein
MAIHCENPQGPVPPDRAQCEDSPTTTDSYPEPRMSLGEILDWCQIADALIEN